MRKALLAAASLLALSASAIAQSHYVAPHVMKNGTFVQGYYQSNANDTRLDNYSSKGNVNPYTGQVGTVDPFAPKPIYQAPPAYQPAPLYTPAPVYTPYKPPKY